MRIEWLVQFDGCCQRREKYIHLEGVYLTHESQLLLPKFVGPASLCIWSSWSREDVWMDGLQMVTFEREKF